MAADEAAERRAALVAQLEREGALHDAAVRAALLAVPRHAFLPDEPLDRAYANAAIPTKFDAAGNSISSASQPAIVATMLEQLALAPGMRVLEIGAGTGYNAALLRTLVGPTGPVTTIDLDADITNAAERHLASIGITDVEIITGDGATGWPANAPYDRVILTVNAGDIAPAWVEQLADGGILVLPLSIGPAQFSIAFAKRNGALHGQSLIPCGFMPLRGRMGGEATGSHSVAPLPGLHMMVTNADAPHAERIAMLLQTPPVPQSAPNLAKGWFAALAFAVGDPTKDFLFLFVSSDDAQYGFVGHGYGIFTRDGMSGCVIRLADSHTGMADTTILAYGNRQTADWLTQLLATWEARGAPRPQNYRVTAVPRDSEIVTPPGGLVIDLPHWRLVFAE